MHSPGQTEDNTSRKPSLIIFSVKIIIIIITHLLHGAESFLKS